MSHDPEDEEYTGTVISPPWKVQLSIKVDGVHLLNIRAGTVEELRELMADAVKQQEAILATVAALEGEKRVIPAIPMPPSSLPPRAPLSPSGIEIGPVTITGIQVAATDKTGAKMASSRYSVKFSDQKTYSTFKRDIGESAQTLSSMGKKVYYSVEPGTNPKFMNLASIRSAESL